MIKSILITLSFIFFSILGLAQALTPYFNYTVTNDDHSLWNISQKHGVSINELKALNQKKDNQIQTGEILKIPKQTPKDPDFVIHTVQKKDKNLYQIGLKYKISVEELMALNHKKSTIIRAGEKLKIPKNGKYIVHVVSNSDKSLWGICQIYDVEVEAVKKANHKKNNQIRRGDHLTIPKEQQIAVSRHSQEEVPPINGNIEGIKAAYDFEANKWRFPYHDRKTLQIFPSIKTGFTNYHQLSPVEYAAFFQNSKDYAPNKEQKLRYFYSIERPFSKSLDGEHPRYLTLREKELLEVKNGYTYDFITLIEVDSVNHSFKILPIFLVRDAFGRVAKNTEKGSFACCADPFPLATYQKTDAQEITSYSTLLTPSIIRYTKVIKTFEKEQIIRCDSSILILQLKTDSVPHPIDSARYINNKKTQRFSNVKRRQELGY
ncbi:LysM peptidoglycan-binding domain-containing protein [Aureispira anguillae]|uniref:LysM peptidoglycan-binding domain-containing protein n=1 Tax=Aureispira anguillae TaxID=2864201 RepID=A0A916DSG5_9BACT|nr:LysM peptidoglycan-binding domain-containing protein [Aureispira anguillae]BDS12519.1 LysM peptidoglycan-binding domain-containing protein [Aureispira anguillae]